MTLPKITNQQQAILQLLYKHRFLDRTHIQALLHHKDYKTINLWLKDLREKDYVTWIYSTAFTEKSKPAIYYLNLNGIRYLRSLKKYPAAELRKRYKESSRQRSFIDRCLILADCCTKLEAKSVGSTHYSYMLEADYIDPESDYCFLTDLGPQLCFIKQGGTQTAYLLEIFDTTAPRYMLKKRLQDYKDFLDGVTWQQYTVDDGSPIVLLAFATIAALTYAKRRIHKLIEDAGEDDDLPIRFTTLEQLRLQGVTGKIWEEL